MNHSLNSGANIEPTEPWFHQRFLRCYYRKVTEEEPEVCTLPFHQNLYQTAAFCPFFRPFPNEGWYIQANDGDLHHIYIFPHIPFLLRFSHFILLNLLVVIGF